MAYHSSKYSGNLIKFFSYNVKVFDLSQMFDYQFPTLTSRLKKSKKVFFSLENVETCINKIILKFHEIFK